MSNEYPDITKWCAGFSKTWCSTYGCATASCQWRVAIECGIRISRKVIMESRIPIFSVRPFISIVWASDDGPRHDPQILVKGLSLRGQCIWFFAGPRTASPIGGRSLESGRSRTRQRDPDSCLYKGRIATGGFARGCAQTRGSDGALRHLDALRHSFARRSGDRPSDGCVFEDSRALSPTAKPSERQENFD